MTVRSAARRRAAPRLRLGARELLVWRASVRRDYDPALEDLLDEPEHGRRRLLRRRTDRRRFALAAGLLRVLAGAYTGTRPDRVRVDRRCARCGGPHGKPALPGGLEASISHSGDVVLVAVARCIPVGVDAEVVDPRLGVEELAPLCLAAEESGALARSAGPGRLRAFLALWTRKEAVLKATGEALLRPPREVVVLGERVLAGRPVFVRELELGPDYVGAVAALRDGCCVRCLDAGALLARTIGSSRRASGATAGGR